MFGSRLKGTDPIVIPEADLSLWDVLVEVVVAHAPGLKGTDGLLDDRPSNI